MDLSRGRLMIIKFVNESCLRVYLNFKISTSPKFLWFFKISVLHCMILSQKVVGWKDTKNMGGNLWNTFLNLVILLLTPSAPHSLPPYPNIIKHISKTFQTSHVTSRRPYHPIPLFTEHEHVILDDPLQYSRNLFRSLVRFRLEMFNFLWIPSCI